MKYILAIDQSTAGTKAILFSPDGNLISRADVPHRQITNDRGWIEHDPEEIYQNVLSVCRMVLQQAQIPPHAIGAIGITNQRETVVCWDRDTQRPVHNAIVWQCGRAEEIVQRLLPNAELIQRRTGLRLSPFFSAAKFSWILENIEEARALADQKRLCCGNIDAWLLFKLSGGKHFKTDYSNASRTQLLNLDTLRWDKEIAAIFGLCTSMLPDICDSGGNFAQTTMDGLFSYPVPIYAVMGDSQAALYANGCHQPNMAKATFGTGTSVMLNVGSERPKNTVSGLVESLAWGLDGKATYVLEGNINFTGAIIRWLVQDVHLLENSSEAGHIAKSVADTNGVYLVPAFSGLGAPYWRSDVRGIISGMSIGTQREHIVRAAEEAIAYQIKDIVEELIAAQEKPLDILCVDGGATKDEFLMPFVADILGIDIHISQMEELSAAGVAYLAAIQAGISTEKQLFARRRHTVENSHMDDLVRTQLYQGWKKSVSMLIG